MPRFIKSEKVEGGWISLAPYRYKSSRFDKVKTLPARFFSDGATGVPDPEGTDAWFMHDILCQDPYWDDGTPLSNADASLVLYDIAVRDGYNLFASAAWIATHLLAECNHTDEHGLDLCEDCQTISAFSKKSCPYCGKEKKE